MGAHLFVQTQTIRSGMLCLLWDGFSDFRLAYLDGKRCCEHKIKPQTRPKDCYISHICQINIQITLLISPTG